MKTITITTQAELDALPKSFEEFTVIYIKDTTEWIRVVAWENSRVEAWGNSRVVARENSHVVAWGNSRVVARENSSVVAWGNSSVEAWGNSRVEAWENSSVVARENSSVVAWENSRVVARENSRVVARENSSVVAWENSSVVARENSSVVARGNSRVEAWENSSVEARENSSVVARENSSADCFDFSFIAVFSATVVIKTLMGYSIASLRGVKPKIEKKSKTATVVTTPEQLTYTKKQLIDLCESDKKGTVILYKSVRPETLTDFYTGKIKYEGVVTAPDWDPDPKRECGGGLHMSRTDFEALSYNYGKVLRCRVKVKDIVVYKHNITKVRVREAEVLK